MLRETRLQSILELLKKEGTVQSNTLCKMFGVTEMTIRRDLDALSASGQLIRIHGGAVLNTETNLSEPPYANRITEHLSAKECIAAEALKYILPGQHVFLDSGTTTLHLAQQLPYSSTSVFITNGLNIALELVTHRELSSIIIGGDLSSNSQSTRGALAEKQFSDFRVDIAFLGCNAISPDGDVLVGNAIETGLKQQAMKFARKIYLLADSSKFGNYSLISYAHVSKFDGIITDNRLSEDIRQHLTQLGATLIITDTPANPEDCGS